MRSDLRTASIFLASAITAASATSVAAQEEIPLSFGTYAQQKKWCKRDRADPAGPDKTEKRAYINLSATEINWNDSVGQISNIKIEGKKIHLTTRIVTQGSARDTTLTLYRKSKTTFSLTGINFFFCGGHIPNPWLGR